MIRCHHEVVERFEAQKRDERAPERSRPVVRRRFEELVASDGLTWVRLSDPSQLRAISCGVRNQLRLGEFDRFVDFIERRFGTAFARQGGLPVGRPQLVAV